MLKKIKDLTIDEAKKIFREIIIDEKCEFVELITEPKKGYKNKPNTGIVYKYIDHLHIIPFYDEYATLWLYLNGFDIEDNLWHLCRNKQYTRYSYDNSYTENELMVGNLMYRLCKNEKKITSICANEIKYCSEIRPIPLTNYFINNYFKNKISIIGDNKWGFANYIIENINGIFYVKFVYSSGDEIINEIEFVHQLQNLYFALTKQKLT